jgi:hypothetical protein
MSRHTIELTSQQSFLLLVGFVVVVWFVLWQVPKFRRGGEGKIPLASYRVAAAFGGPFLNLSGSFYRITLYDSFFVAVFFGCEKIRYSDVRNLKFRRAGIPSVSMKVHGVKVRIYSELGRLEDLYKKLVAKVSAGR